MNTNVEKTVAGRLSLASIALAFVAYAAGKGSCSFLSPIPHRDQWNELFYRTSEIVADNVPQYAVLKERDWDASGPTYPDMDDVIDVLCLYAPLHLEWWSSDTFVRRNHVPEDVSEYILKVMCSFAIRIGVLRYDIPAVGKESS